MLSQSDLDFLTLTATLRYPTVRAYMAAANLSPDQVYRQLARLRLLDRPVIDTFKQPVARIDGSEPKVHILTAHGAQALKTVGINVSPTLVKNVSRRRRDVLDGQITQLRHDVFVSQFLGVFIGASEANGRAVLDIKWSRERTFTLDRELFRTLGKRWWRMQADPNLSYAVYAPDLFFDWQHPDGYREPVVVEIETGAGQGNYHSIAWAKTLKIQALYKSFRRKKVLAGMQYDKRARLHALVWTRSSGLEEEFRSGAVSAAGGEMVPLWITTNDFLPLELRDLSSKDDAKTAVRLQREQITRDIWRWLQEPEVESHALPFNSVSMIV